MSSNFDSNVNGNSGLKRNSFDDNVGVSYQPKDNNEHIPSIIDNVPIYEDSNNLGWASFDPYLPSWNSIIFVFTVCYSVLLQGVDYGIVMPSMWGYMQYHDPNVTNVLFGAAMSSFSFASLVTAPAVGTLFDILPMRLVCLLLTAVGLLGSMIYGLAVNNLMVIAGRILCGISYNIFTGANVFVIRSSSVSERSAMFTRVTISFAVGTALGPAINWPLSKIKPHDFYPFQLSSYSSVGFLMACLFLINGITFLFLFREPKKEAESEIPLKMIDEPQRTCTQEWIAIFSKFPVVVLIVTQFLVIFTQSTVEVLVTPLTESWYKFEVFGNSLLFTAMTVCVIIALVIVGFLTRCLQDRTILMMGHLITGAGTIIFVIFLVESDDTSPTHKIPLYQFVMVCMSYISAIAFYQTVLASLFSKLLDDPSLDGRGQSVMSSANALGAILGPLVSMLTLPLSILYVPAIMGGLWVIVLFLLLISWHRMYIRHEVYAEIPNDEYMEGIFDEESDILATSTNSYYGHFNDQTDLAYNSRGEINTSAINSALYDQMPKRRSSYNVM